MSQSTPLKSRLAGRLFRLLFGDAGQAADPDGERKFLESIDALRRSLLAKDEELQRLRLRKGRVLAKLLALLKGLVLVLLGLLVIVVLLALLCTAIRYLGTQGGRLADSVRKVLSGP